MDTSAFITGYEVSDVEAEHYTVQSVRDELSDGGLKKLRFDNAVRSGRLKVVSPELEYVEEAAKATSEMGEEGVLSEVDSRLLALGLQLKAEDLEPVIVSDDYSVQNIANKLGLGFKSLATPGIKRQFEWTVYCPGCRRTFRTPQPEGICPICGTKLKRRPVRKKKIE